MCRATFILVLFSCFVPRVYAQNAFVQAAYAGADPQLLTVDVYFSAFGAQVGMLDNLDGGGAATTFLEVPANLTITASVAPGNSTSIADAFTSFDRSFAPNTTNLIVAAGVWNPDVFATNPDGQEISIQLFELNTARQTANQSGEADLIFFNGSTDTPTVDIFIRDGAQVADDLAFGDFSASYISLVPGTYTFDVADASTQTVIASFQVEIAAPLLGQAATVGLLGFSDPSANQNGEALSMIAMFVEGAVKLDSVPTSTDLEKEDALVGSFALHANYPNPFNPASTIAFEVREQAFIRLDVYNSLGQRVATLVEQTLPPGQYNTSFDGSRLPSGLYLYTMQARDFRSSRTMMLVK